MEKDKKPTVNLLRQKAEALLKNKPLKKGSELSENETRQLIYDLHVHHIELELQNEELTQAKTEADAAVENYSELYDFAPSGYFTLSRQGKIIELNLRGANILGMARSRIKNSQFGFFVSDDTKPIFNLFLDKVFGSSTKASCEVILATEYNLPIYVHMEGIISYNSEACLVTIVDITEVKQTIALLELSNRQKSLILEASGEGILGFDLAGNHTFVNPAAAKLLGFSLDELMGKESHTIYHHHYQDGTLFPAKACPIRQTYLIGKPYLGEDYFWRKDGTGFMVELSSLPILDDFRITGAVVTFRDITHRKAIEKALKEKIDELKRFQKETADFELMIIELKKEVNELLLKSGQPEKYNS